MKNRSAMVLCLTITTTIVMSFGINPVKVNAQQAGTSTRINSEPTAAVLVGAAANSTDNDGSERKRQPRSATEPPASESKSAAGNVSDSDRIHALEDALQEQNNKLIQMQKLLEEQQRLMQLITAKTPGAANDQPRAENSANVLSAVANSASAADTSRDATVSTQQPPPSLEDRLKKVEERVTRIGPLRLGGDFRLRLDATLRPPTDPLDPALQHV